MPKILATSPHFLVSDLVAAARYYEEQLGFSIAEYWGDPPAFAMPQRDGIIVMLNQVDRLPPRPNGTDDVWDAYFWCSNVADLHEEYCQSSADIVHEPTVRGQYNMLEMAVRDLDGYMLVFAERIHVP